MTNKPAAPPLPRPLQPPPTPPPPRPTPSSNPFANRLGARAEWQMMPLADKMVCFDLNAPGQLMNDLLGLPSDEEITIERIIQTLDADKSLVEKLKTQLDAVWESYDLHGALMVYTWRDDLKQSLNQRLIAIKQPPIYLRALDPLLILNVLARSRTSLLLASAPLALERPFLSRALGTDDPRLLELVKLTGYVEEALFEPPPPPPEDPDEDETP